MEWNIKVTPKTLKESINYTANIKVGTDEQTLRRLKRIEIVGFWKLLAWQFFEVHFCCCNVWINACLSLVWFLWDVKEPILCS